jgi:Ulp1 family protease
VVCTQQQNGYDCGVWTLLFARAVCRELQTAEARDVLPISAAMLPDTCITERRGWKQLVEELQLREQ